MRKAEQIVTRQGKDIFLNRLDLNWKKPAYTTYREDILEFVKENNWHLKNDRYPNSSKVGSLHRCVMNLWYGEEATEFILNKGYVIDHIDNDSLNCRVENLAFLTRDRNSSKGLNYDKKRKDYSKCALNIFKDFHEDTFQITVGFNEPYCCKDDKGLWCEVQELALLYARNSFEVVLLEAERLLLKIQDGEDFDLLKFEADDMYATPVPTIDEIPLEERGKPVMVVDGKVYLDQRYAAWIKSPPLFGWSIGKEPPARLDD